MNSQVRELVESAIEAGYLSRAVRDRIMRAIYADHIVTKEEAHLWSDLQRRVWQGEVQIY